jgi:ergothioneine biosynthesis protein EgtB
MTRDRSPLDGSIFSLKDTGTWAAPQAPKSMAHRGLADAYASVRAASLGLCEGMVAEDYVVQSMPDVSPTKWHLAHTSWFFETFVLKPHLGEYAEFDPSFAFLFNSYYVQAGPRHCRAQRGYLSRPTVSEVVDYRLHVDAAMDSLLSGGVHGDDLGRLVTLGLNHEQQHQELMLTDIKHVFSVNPLRPALRSRQRAGARGSGTPVRWIGIAEGVHEVGHDGRGFSFDNELPRHRFFIEPFSIADRLATNAEYLEFIADRGYERPELWLSMGWDVRQQNGWAAPFYWESRDGEWWSYTLAGMHPVDPAEPVCHLSYFEADAFARWSGARLPTEQEWEVAAAGVQAAGNFVESGALHPTPAGARKGNYPRQMFGDVWEWTRSQYSPYPGYAAAEGAIGEYNGKFMCNQFVLRGGSCATPESHIRRSYRNFFPPEACWQFTGVRLARDE